MNIAVIFAGGVGSRMRSKGTPKQFLEVFNKPIIIYTLEVFEDTPEIDATVVVCIKDWIPYLKKQLKKFEIKKVKAIVPGGESGQLSIYNGLCAAEEIANGEKSIVVINDGVRPLISPELVAQNIECVKEHGGCVTSGPVTETVVVVDKNNKIEKAIMPRDMSRVGKAPQSFYLNDIIGAHRKALSEGRTDFADSNSMMNYYGFEVYMVDGPANNIKITTPQDYYAFRAVLEERENSQIYGIE